MKHNATYISLPLFILLYIAFSDCADPSEKKEKEIEKFNSPNPVVVYLPPNKKAVKTCAFWRMGQFALVVLTLKANAPLIDFFKTEIIENGSTFVEGTLPNLKERAARRYAGEVQYGNDHSDRLDDIEAFTKNESEVYTYSLKNYVKAKNNMIFTPNSHSEFCKKFVKYPPQKTDNDNDSLPDQLALHLFSKKKCKGPICSISSTDFKRLKSTAPPPPNEPLIWHLGESK